MLTSMLGVLLWTGCRSVPVTVQSGNLKRLQNHHQFEAAAKAAPQLMYDVGDTIADLEAQIKELKAQ